MRREAEAPAAVLQSLGRQLSLLVGRLKKKWKTRRLARYGEGNAKGLGRAKRDSRCQGGCNPIALIQFVVSLCLTPIPFGG